ncbi:uncharacterized protein LOC136039387 isoform X1 [Artemia franciscana]|uniref:uncharacterized protein LOC136039387 isoform X1 n=1 Tax=Artemia franciscana TaxID=6661 RepID=UPI0032DB4781
MISCLLLLIFFNVWHGTIYMIGANKIEEISLEEEPDDYFYIGVEPWKVTDVSFNISEIIRQHAMQSSAHSFAATEVEYSYENSITLTRKEHWLFEWDELFSEVQAGKVCGFRALCQTRLWPKKKKTAATANLNTSMTVKPSWEGDKRHGPNTMDPTLFGASPCHCDKECVHYGDCCIDAARRWWDQGSYDDANKWACRSIHPSEENMQEKLLTYIFMTAHCPDGTKEDLRKLCERRIPDDSYNYILDLPVFSLNTKKTYANVYCARCNTDFHLAQWNASVECTANVKNINLSLPELIAGATYYRGKLAWTRPVGEADENGWPQTVTCYLYVQEFKNVSYYLEEFNARRCLPSMRQCHPSWTDSKTRQKCNSYALHVVDRETNVFRNPHCAKCNFVDISAGLKCHRTSLRIHTDNVYSLTPSFSVIFDFVGGGGGKVGHGRRCKIDEFWDDIHSECHAVTCGSLYEVRKGKCVLISSPPLSANISQALKNNCYTIILRKEEFKISPNGSITVNGTSKLYEIGDYELTNNNEARVCAIHPEKDFYFKFSRFQSYVSQLGLVISLICLAVHIMVYSFLPKLRNMPGKNLLSLSCALFMAQMLFLTGIDKNSDKGVCVVVGLSLHWFYLAAFFWMSVMSFDICRTFRSKTYRPDRNSRTFGMYSLYAWGGPTCTVALALLLDNTSLLPEFAPEYGRALCWINSRYGLLLFFIIPVLFLLLENLVFFFLTIFSILSQQKAAKYAQESAQRKRDSGESGQASDAGKTNRVRFYLYVKLAIIMGLTWIFGFVAATAGLPSLWYPFIIFNSLQGAAIFVGFDMKKKIFEMLWEKLFGRAPTCNFLTRESGNQSSSKTATTSFIMNAEHKIIKKDLISRTDKTDSVTTNSQSLPSTPRKLRESPISFRVQYAYPPTPRTGSLKSNHRLYGRNNTPLWRSKSDEKQEDMDDGIDKRYNSPVCHEIDKEILYVDKICHRSSFKNKPESRYS